MKSQALEFDDVTMIFCQMEDLADPLPYSAIHSNRPTRRRLSSVAVGARRRVRSCRCSIGDLSPSWTRLVSFLSSIGFRVVGVSRCAADARSFAAPGSDAKSPLVRLWLSPHHSTLPSRSRRRSFGRHCYYRSQFSSPRFVLGHAVARSASSARHCRPSGVACA